MKMFRSGVLALVALALASFGAVSGVAQADAAPVFDDVPPGAYYEDAVNWAVSYGVTQGINPTTFAPDQVMNRAQAVVFIWREAGSPTGSPAAGFTDVVAGSYYAEAANWAAAEGITTGVTATTFDPEGPVTRAMYVTFLWRAAGSPTGSPAAGFTDVPANSIFAEAINWAADQGITKGVGANMFAPNALVTRSQGIALQFRVPVGLQILAINDFHGNIASTSSSFGGVGRADFLAANMRAAQADTENSIIVSAGDLIGASPLVSALFHDEPTIEAMNLIGLDINAVGNHEFDEGPDELLRMKNGGPHPVDPDGDGIEFAGADFDFLAANVEVDATGDTIFPEYSVRDFNGAEVVFIGLTLEGTPNIVTPSGVAGLTFHDEVETINGLVTELKGEGHEAFVILIHEGGFSDGGSEGDDCDGGLVGPLADIVAGLDSAVDLVIAGHVNDEFVCEQDGIWVTMADNAGRLFTNIDAQVSRDTNDLTIRAIDNVRNVQAGVTPAPDLTELIDKYTALAAPLADQIVGEVTEDITRTNNADGESELGDLIADVQLAATSAPAFGGAEIAFMNPGGIRNDLLFAPTGTEDPGDITYAEMFSVQPFGNSLVTMTLTGSQIMTLLAQQWEGREASPLLLQVSDTFSYQYVDFGPADTRALNVRVDGSPIVMGDDYRVTVNSFLADGGDGFPILTEGTDRLGGEVDLDAFVTYAGANSPLSPPPGGRFSLIVPVR